MDDKAIGKYRIIRLLGEGGMASVYEAEHVVLGTRVAIKVLNPLLSANAQIREQFKNEARVMASLNHPGIIRVVDFDESSHQLSIVMEYLEGEDLNDLVRREGALNEKQIREIFPQILSAFQYAHEKGILHRDIKPSNIFIGPNRRVKVLDFGIAKLFGQGNETTQTGTQMGTPIYMSPEQVKSEKSIDFRSDIYSLGITLFFMTNGRPPYDVTLNSQFDIFTNIVFEPLPWFTSVNTFRSNIERACEKDRERRFQSCDEWLRALEKNHLAHSADFVSGDSVLATSTSAVLDSGNKLTEPLFEANPDSQKGEVCKLPSFSDQLDLEFLGF
jgi:serine/threonine protein kinase